MKLLLDFSEQLVSPGKFLVKSWKELFLRATILIGSPADAAVEDYEGEGKIFSYRIFSWFFEMDSKHLKLSGKCSANQQCISGDAAI
jgi:hypothetical protein